MGVVDLPEPRIGAASKLAPKPIKFVLNWGRRYSLWVFNFGLACCAIEFIATSMSRHDFIRLGVIPFAPGPRQADLMVVSGTVSDKMAPAVKRLYEQMPEPKYVISFGACSNCGGPYWDSYCVTKGVDQIIPVDVYVPGCPPRPEALLHGIIRLQEKIAAESLGSRYTQQGEPVAPAPEVARKPPTPAVLRRPLVLPPMPEPEEIEAAEEPTLSIDLPVAEWDAVRAQDVTSSEGEPPVKETPAEEVPDENASAETQRLSPVEEVPDEAPSAKTQQLPPVEEAPAETTERLPSVEEPEAAPEPESGGTDPLPPAEEVRREAAAFEETQEFQPGQESTREDPLPVAEPEGGPASAEKTRRDLPPAEEVRKAAETRQRARWRAQRLRKFAEPPPVDAVDDPDIIPGLSDDD
ncbi:NADH-quinone oxidoreductase subunit B [Actinoallomurus acaciae]|uniref:NADH-quinone oxidoreductase subunit B n=1 Tax=Actinoallomurus acaciae TaxID=502577 RepID=A0ABV5YXM3_9ACTN